MEQFLTWLKQLQLDIVWQTAVLVAASVLCITVHETCHGLAAYAMGDPTAKQQGRLSLNPLKHIDLIGLVMMAVVHFGWAKPVPIDARRFRNPKAGMALSALAGPLSNVVLAYLAVLLYAVCAYFYVTSSDFIWYVLMLFCYYVELISAGLAVFNILPIPPLDGSKVLFSFLPQTWYAKLMRYERFGMPVLVLLLLTDVLDTPLRFLRDALTGALEFAGQWPFELLMNLPV